MQMVLCMKLISFAWAVHDGQRPLEELDETQKSTRIEKVPGLLPFLGYACVLLPLRGQSVSLISHSLPQLLLPLRYRRPLVLLPLLRLFHVAPPVCQGAAMRLFQAGRPDRHPAWPSA